MWYVILKTNFSNSLILEEEVNCASRCPVFLLSFNPSSFYFEHFIENLFKLFYLAVSCPVGQTYTECGSSCVSTCSDVLTSTKCVEECVEGCSCPNGTVVSDTTGNCVPATQCGCLFGNKTIADGVQVKKDCNSWYVFYLPL